MRTSQKRATEDALGAGDGNDFLEYSHSMLMSLAQIAGKHQLQVYAHLLNLAAAEAGLLLVEGKKDRPRSRYSE